MPGDSQPEEVPRKREWKTKVRHEWHKPEVMGPVWLIGWLFTIGYLHLPFFWKGVLALFIWPFYLGRALGH
ncbi:MAG: hypothetical protein ABIK44_06505 [candidate division WOR-3 bacterium]